MADYELMRKQLESFIEAEAHPLPVLSNLSALLMEGLTDVNWAGFYLMEGGSLLLGPFQGRPACIRIPAGKGVCGAAAETAAVQLVPDVHQFPGHIACDSRSNSEVVVPLCVNGRVVGVMDLDSPTLGRFTPADAEGLAALGRVLEERVAWDAWRLE